MNPIVRSFLTKERVCVLSGILIDGGPHSSTVHYSHQDQPLRLFFQTWDESMKAQTLTQGQNNKASVVVGFSEQDNLTLQMRGTIRIVSDPDELEAIYQIHYSKHPFAEKYKDSNTRFIEFTPTWWRYSDFNFDPEKIIDMTTP